VNIAKKNTFKKKEEAIDDKEEALEKLNPKIIKLRFFIEK